MLSPSPKGFQSPKFSDSDFADSDVRKALIYSLKNDVYFFQIAKKLEAEYALRRKMLITRLSATLQSFSWSDRGKEMSSRVAKSMTIFNKVSIYSSYFFYSNNYKLQMNNFGLLFEYLFYLIN
jgi:hypothetical protein